MIIQNDLSLTDKLEILSDAAKYDVACTSSGVTRKGSSDGIGNTVSRGICHCFSADGRCISLLKILLTNECIYDCKYCVNRTSRDVVRTAFTPEEVAKLTIEFYRRNYIEGLFLSSGIMKNPDYTMEQMIQAITLLRNEYHFNGYIHVKAIPGASSDRIQELGYLADRMSINLELPTAEGLRELAPNKHRKTILTPMKQIQLGIQQNKMIQKNGKQIATSKEEFMLPGRSISQDQDYISDTGLIVTRQTSQNTLAKKAPVKSFVPAGQSTQMIIGATNETDYQILNVVEGLYRKFSLKRVFYSAFVNTTFDSSLPAGEEGPPLLREHRLYQADWLLRFYGFEAKELLSEERPNFNMMLDPKCNWAINHLETFPVEVNRAPYATLLRVPGIGVKSAQRIMQARRYATLDFQDLKKIGVVLKRAHYFITCKGKMLHSVKIEEDYILNYLLDVGEKLPTGIGGSGLYEQISLYEQKSFLNANPTLH